MNELLQLFAALKIPFYRQQGRLGDTRWGFRSEAMPVARKDKS